jgi:hypothetical protein
MSKEAMQMALEALENAGEAVYARGGIAAVGSLNIAAQALRQALETEQEPVAWMFVNEDGECEQIEYGPVFDDPGVTPLYASPPKREWVGLTDDDYEELLRTREWGVSLIEAVEAKLKKKNNDRR